ncbi:MAG: hypothetical protein ACYS5W_06340 [Planctomycetota bacterium]
MARRRLARTRTRPRTRARRQRFWWADLPYEELLDLRISELGLSIEGTALEHRVQQLFDELQKAGLRFKPYGCSRSRAATTTGA